MESNPRRAQLLEVAIEVFVRFGYRKTSMDEVARAADLSRQGLYLHFPTKEALFAAALEQFLEGSLAAVAATAGDAALGVQQRLVGAFDAWAGRFVGMPVSAADLAEMTRGHQPLVEAAEVRFEEAIVKLVRSAGLVAAYRAQGLSAKQLAQTLYATARGLKHACASRAEFVERMGVAVRAMCAVLPEAA
jgi:AcrR family transcriptional regulator